MRKNYFARLIFSAVICIALSLSVAIGCTPAEGTTPKFYTVAFDSNGGSSVPSQTVESGKTITKPAEDPARDGYDFVTWLDIDNNEYDFSTAVTKNFTLFAKWNLKSGDEPDPEKPQTFTVTFDTDGGSSIAAVKVESGKKVTKPDDPTKDGFTFKEWILPDGSAFDFSTAVTSDTTLTAGWTKNSTTDPGGDTETKYYTVTFNSNNGSAVWAQYVEDGKKAAEPAEPTRSGYVFDGWYKEAALTNSYSFDTAVTSDITLHAKWAADTISKYTVTFNSNGGSNVLPQEVTRGNTAAAPADPEKEGFVFGGWYTANEPNSLFNFNSPLTSDITLYAKWTPVAEAETLEVKFETDGGSKISSQEVDKNGLAVKPNDPAKTGYTFGGWYNGETEYDFNSPVTSNLTLTAKWTENTVPPEGDMLSATIVFNDMESSVYTAGTKLNNGLIALNKGDWTVDESNGKITDSDGKEISVTKRLKSGGSRTMEIDLSAYTGKVKIQFFVRTASRDDLTRSVSLASDGAEAGKQILSEDKIFTFEVTVDGGAKYTLTTSGGINFYGIVIIPAT